MKKLFLTFFALTALVVTFASCSKDAESIEPKLGDIVFSKNPCHVGDTVTATVKYLTPGQYIGFSKNMSSYKNLPCTKYLDQVDGNSNTEPSVTFVVELSAGKYDVVYTGQIEKYAGEQLWGNKLMSKGTIIVE